jgi:hypothetical protein
VRTTEAAFRLSLPPVEKPESPAESQTWHKDSFSFEEKSSPWKGWETKDDWLTWNRRKIVWLPPDYRKGTIAISGRITVANELGFPLKLTTKISAPLARHGYLQAPYQKRRVAP